ncbi:MAG: cation:dicarboxylase symporter family transporter [Thermodesulfobacteriota bacterium]
MSSSPNINKLLKFLSHPLTIGAGIIAGFIIGLYSKESAAAIAPIGKMYLSFLNMCILPIIITSIISGLAKLIRTPELGKKLPKIASSFTIMLFIPSLAGVLAASVGKPGKGLSEADMDALGRMVSEQSGASEQGAGGMVDFLVGIVPWNLFDSLSKGQTMSIVFACIFIGIAAGYAKNGAIDDMIALVDTMGEVFNILFNWALYLLPIGICAVIAEQMAGLSLSVFRIMFGFITLIYLAMVLLVMAYAVAIWRSAAVTFGQTLKAMRQPLFLAFTVDSSFIAIKSCLDSLEDELGVDRKIAALIVPFTMVANRQGKIFLFSFTTMFMAQLYGIDLTFSHYAVIIIGASLAGMAAPGGGPMLVPSIAVILSAVNIPIALAYVIFTITGPVVDRVLSTFTVQGSCLLATLAGSKGPSSTGTKEK